MVTLGIILTCSPAQAVEFDDWRMELRPTYSWWTVEDDNMHGFGTGLMGSWRAFDTLYIKLDTEIIFLDMENPGNKYLWEISAGANYDIDITPLTVTMGTGIGPLLTKDEGQDWKTDASWHLLLAFQYSITKDFALGIEGRYHFIFTDFNTSPLFFTASLKAVLTF